MAIAPHTVAGGTVIHVEKAPLLEIALQLARERRAHIDLGGRRKAGLLGRHVCHAARRLAAMAPIGAMAWHTTTQIHRARLGNYRPAHEGSADIVDHRANIIIAEPVGKRHHRRPLAAVAHRGQHPLAGQNAPRLGCSEITRRRVEHGVGPGGTVTAVAMTDTAVLFVKPLAVIKVGLALLLVRGDDAPLRLLLFIGGLGVIHKGGANIVDQRLDLPGRQAPLPTDHGGALAPLGHRLDHALAAQLLRQPRRGEIARRRVETEAGLGLPITTITVTDGAILAVELLGRLFSLHRHCNKGERQQRAKHSTEGGKRHNLRYKHLVLKSDK